MPHRQQQQQVARHHGWSETMQQRCLLKKKSTVRSGCTLRWYYGVLEALLFPPEGRRRIQQFTHWIHCVDRKTYSFLLPCSISVVKTHSFHVGGAVEGHLQRHLSRSNSSRSTSTHISETNISSHHSKMKRKANSAADKGIPVRGVSTWKTKSGGYSVQGMLVLVRQGLLLGLRHGRSSQWPRKKINPNLIRSQIYSTALTR